MSCGLWKKLTGILAVFGEELVDLLANFVVGELDVVLGGAVLGHEVEETVVDVDLQKRGLIRVRATPEKCTHELVFVTEDVRDIHVVGRGRDILLQTRRFREII